MSEIENIFYDKFEVFKNNFNVKLLFKWKWN